MKPDHNEEEEDDDDDDDRFDGLSDELLSVIFSKVLDAQSLCRCSIVSKRFASLIPMVDSVFVAVPSPKSKPNPSPFLNFVLKLTQFFHQTLVPHSSMSFHSDGTSIYRFSGEVLKNFSHLTSLCILLPSHGGELGGDGSGSYLKWEAEFGRGFQSCVVLGATTRIPETRREEDGFHDESDLTAEELKLRVAWTISCLFAASARHCMVQYIVADKLVMLRNLVIEDRNKQGRLLMGEDQIKELRTSMKLQYPPWERTKFPAICIKLWYVPLLELPEATGSMMKGVTVIVIRPVDQEMKKMKSDEDLLANAFDGDDEAQALSEAVKELLKEKKPCLMEMNSF